jgi:adenine-specific DNA-methyltransferase
VDSVVADGVIFVSIDDKEVTNTRRVCDEIFGEEIFIACLVWEKGRKNDARRFSVGQDYMVVYARDLSLIEAELPPWREQKLGVPEIVRQ